MDTLELPQNKSIYQYNQSKLNITVTITIADIRKFNLPADWEGQEKTFKPREWQTYTGKKSHAIRQSYTNEMKDRDGGKEPRDLRGVVGLTNIKARKRPAPAKRPSKAEQERNEKELLSLANNFLRMAW